MNYSLRRCVCALLPAVLAVVTPVRGDGLIFQLPIDGTFAEFTGEGTANTELKVPDQVLSSLDESGKERLADLSGEQQIRKLIRVSSVGSTNWAGRPCRWIELGATSTITNRKTGHVEKTDTNTIKMLIPEEHLNRGSDPLDNVVLAFWNPKGADLKGVPAENGFDRVRYEIDRFLPAFAPPLRDENRLPSQTIQTPIGEFRDCEVITGTSKFDRPTRGEGYWKEDFVWTIALHPNAPFGVVRVICKSTGSEVNPPITVECTQSDVLTLTKTGRDAKNALPDSGEMNSPAVDSK